MRRHENIYIMEGNAESMYRYRTRGTCSTEILFEVEEGVVTACRFVDGCLGNTTGVAKLVIGRQVQEVVDLLKGIQCRSGTSCPDQLARALEAMDGGMEDLRKDA